MILTVCVTFLIHHEREEFGEREERGLSHGVQRFQHCLLHLERVRPERDAASELARVRVHCASVADVVACVWMRRTCANSSL